jgi:N-acetylmuramoyl-L-alanine amidase
MNDMAQNEHLRESYDLATTIQTSVGAVHPGPSRGVKQANFAVLRTAFMPAVLIETGFGSNPKEAQWLASSGGQRTLAVQIADATVEYLEKYELRVRSGTER